MLTCFLFCRASALQLNFSKENMINAVKLFLLIIIPLALFSSCGEGTVDIGQNTYTPKIVVEGYLYPGQKVSNIRITKNIPLNTAPDTLSLILFTADVRIIDLQSNKEYKLTFSPNSYAFEYTGNDLEIGYNKSYRLSVSANVNGQNLATSCITHIPNSGFKIERQLSQIQPLFYQEKDAIGNIKNYSLVFNPSPGTSFYAFSIVALDANDSTFNYNNAYIDVKREDVIKDLDRYKYQFRWLQNVNSTNGSITFEMNWINFWFYGKYRVVAYAGDDNYKNFSLTYRLVQEFDGNFHEPAMALEGDGIGVFGSVIADTVYLEVKPPL